MRSVQDRPEPDSDGYSSCEDRVADALAANTSAQVARERSNAISIANTKVKLSYTLRRYGINVVKTSPFDVWSAAIRCPFPFHKGGNERTPSFSYNFEKDYFNCLGCQKGGRTVEFIAYKEGVSKIVVAEQIIADMGGYVEDTDLSSNNPEIEKHLFEISTYIQTLVNKHRNNNYVLKQIDKVVWWFDLYLISKGPKQRITVEDLLERLSRVKQLLEAFE